MHPKVANLKYALWPKDASIIWYTNVTQYSTHSSGRWAQPTLPLNPPHPKTRTNLTYIQQNHNITQNYYLQYDLHTLYGRGSHTHMPPCKSLLGTVMRSTQRRRRLGQLLQQQWLLKVPHPSAHPSACHLHVNVGGGQWPSRLMASLQTEGIWGGGEVLDNRNLGATDNSPDDSIN